MWEIKQTDKGWEWVYFNSAYGAAGGVAKTLAEAKVKLAIAQADVLESPFPRAVQEVMLSDPEKFAKDYPDPE